MADGVQWIQSRGTRKPGFWFGRERKSRSNCWHRVSASWRCVGRGVSGPEQLPRFPHVRPLAFGHVVGGSGFFRLYSLRRWAHWGGQLHAPGRHFFQVSAGVERPTFVSLAFVFCTLCAMSFLGGIACCVHPLVWCVVGETLVSAVAPSLWFCMHCGVALGVWWLSSRF